MGKFSISLPDYAGMRCGNSDYGAKQTENIITLLSAVFPKSSYRFGAFHSKVSYLFAYSHHKAVTFTNIFRGLNYVN